MPSKITFISGRNPAPQSGEFRVELQDKATVKYNGKVLGGVVQQIKPGKLLVRITDTAVCRWFDRSKVLEITNLSTKGNINEYLPYVKDLEQVLKQLETPTYKFKKWLRGLKIKLKRMTNSSAAFLATLFKKPKI